MPGAMWLGVWGLCPKPSPVQQPPTVPTSLQSRYGVSGLSECCGMSAAGCGDEWGEVPSPLPRPCAACCWDLMGRRRAS